MIIEIDKKSMADPSPLERKFTHVIGSQPAFAAPKTLPEPSDYEDEEPIRTPI